MDVISEVARHFSGRAPAVREIYDRILHAIAPLGAFSEDPKKTSIHLNRKTAFAGVATTKTSLTMTFKSRDDIASQRIVRKAQASAHRWYLDVRLTSPEDVDDELVSWLKDSYGLSE